MISDRLSPGSAEGRPIDLWRGPRRRRAGGGVGGGGGAGENYATSQDSAIKRAPGEALERERETNDGRVQLYGAEKKSEDLPLHTSFFLSDG